MGRLFIHKSHPHDNVKLVTVVLEGKLRVAVVTKKMVAAGAQLFWDYSQILLPGFLMVMHFE